MKHVKRAGWVKKQRTISIGYEIGRFSTAPRLPRVYYDMTRREFNMATKAWAETPPNSTTRLHLKSFGPDLDLNRWIYFSIH